MRLGGPSTLPDNTGLDIAEIQAIILCHGRPDDAIEATLAHRMPYLALPLCSAAASGAPYR